MKERKEGSLKRFIVGSAVVLGTAYITLNHIAKKEKPNTVYDDKPEEKNPLEGKDVIFISDDTLPENADGVKGYLKETGRTEERETMYDMYIKRFLDKVLSFGGLMVLAPLYAAISFAVFIDDPGPVIFTQKRVGKNKEYFKLHKFRSMKMSTPHDCPTHMLENPDQYITTVGKFLREHSLDELPQIWDIFVGNMSVIGPRPALYNQDLLIAERDKYRANSVKPGLTGWAQINGRDELKIGEKARLDGEYVKNESLLFDAKCFLGTIPKLGHDEDVVEGVKTEYKDSWKSYELTEEPLVSVVIPTYKRSVRYLSRAVSSVIMQSYKNLEIIVIDDSPSDYEYRDEIKKYMEDLEYPNISYYQNEENMGGSLARNRGISYAKGKYITFLDDDDEYMRDKVLNQVKFMEYNGCDLSFSDMIMHNTEGRVVDYRSYNDIPSFDNETLLHYHLMKHMTGTPTFMFKADKLKEIGGFIDSSMAEEFYLMLKSIESGLKIAYLPECDVKVYKHKDGGLSQGMNKVNGEKKLYEFKKQYFDRLTDDEIKFINFRHHAVMVVAYLRNNMYPDMVKEGVEAFTSSPKDFVKEVTGFAKKVIKHR